MVICGNKIKDVDILNEWWLYWLYIKIKQKVILKCYNITFYSFTLHNFLYMRGRRYKILRNEDLGYNCGRKNYFVILWKTTVFQNTINGYWFWLSLSVTKFTYTVMTTIFVSIVILRRLISLPIRRFMQVAFKGMPICTGHFL